MKARCIVVTGVFAWLPGVGTAGQPVIPTHLVMFEEQPLAVYDGSVPGLRATTPAVLGTRKLDSRSANARAYLAWLDARQDQHLRDIERALGHAVPVRFRYHAAGNGMAIRIADDEAPVVARVPGVRQVVPDAMEHAGTDAGPVWIGAPAIWTGTGTGGLGPSKGEGVIVGLIDTGVNMAHPSFSDTPADGYVYTNPFGPGVHIGACGGPYPCNEKLVGAWDFADGTGTPPEADGPEDSNGHGSHTASTAVGNVLLDPAITGVAPHATLITYDACDQSAGCALSATSAAIDQAVIDGVDVISYSIGGTGGRFSPWALGPDPFFLDAMAAGILVSACGFNSGPAPGTVDHLGPWLITVANSSHDRETPIGHQNGLINMSGGVNPPADVIGASLTKNGYGPAPIVYAANYSNGTPDPEHCSAPFPAGTWSGQIVLCDDGGGSAWSLKGQNVLAGGAGALVVAAAVNAAERHYPLPATMLDGADGSAVKTWLSTGSGHAATIPATTLLLDPALADVMATSSGRGPGYLDLLKPDVSAPGTRLIAAYRAGSPAGYQFPSYQQLGGTSMSTPHVAGAAALLMPLHPSWTPMQIKSALMTTSHRGLFKEDGVTPADPLDDGAGRTDLTQASRAGLLFDETYVNFLAADPLTGGDPRTLNVPSMQDWNCVRCSFTRTAEATVGTTWTVTTSASTGVALTVTPSSFTSTIGGQQQIRVDVDASALPYGTWGFGEVDLTPAAPGVPVSHLPVAVAWSGHASDFDVVVGQGLGQPNPNEVRGFRGDGSAVAVDFFAYSAGQWGTTVSTGRIRNPNLDAIITGPGPGPLFGPQVRGFSTAGAPISKVNYYAYGTLKYGVNTAAGDVDGEAAFEEILTAPGPGPVFGPHIRGWNYDNASLSAIQKVSYYAYGTLKYGANVAAGSLDADAYAEIVTGPGPGAIFGPQVRGWQYDASAVAAMSKVNFFAFAANQFGVNVGPGDADGDGFAEIVASPGPGASASFPARFLGFNYDDTSVSPLPGYDATTIGQYGGRPGATDLGAVVTGSGPDPAVDSTVTPFYYDGTTLRSMPVGFVPFGTSLHGVTIGVGDLNY